MRNSFFKLFFLCLIHIFLLFVYESVAIVDGEEVEWNRHGYLAKILGRNKEGKVHSCTGTLITTTLVLTSAECVVNRATRVRITEFSVILPRLKDEQEFFSGSMIATANSWALLKINEQNITEICPEEPVRKRIARLNIKPSLVHSSMVGVDAQLIKESSCYLLGFETVANATLFPEQRNVMRLPLETINDPSTDGGKYHSRVIHNSTACFDDTGAALICHLLPFGCDIQVGMLQSLRVADDQKLNLASMSMCSMVKAMEYSMVFDDKSLVAAIQKHDVAEFVATYRACGFI